LNLYIARKAFNALRTSTDNKKLVIAGVLSAWIAFHAQSLISIDNVGLSIWGWILGGSLIGLSISAQGYHSGADQFKRRSNEINLKRAIISGSITVIAIVVVSMLYRVENLSFQASGNYSLQTEQDRNTYRNINLKLYNASLSDPMSKLQAAINLAQSGFVDDSIIILKDMSKKDSRNLDVLNTLAQLSEQLKDYESAIEIRKQIIVLDPWNAANYLSLGVNYKILGDFYGSNQMLLKILSFAPSHPISAQAKIELAS
jgi:tetratricopeptide (TPR) repeat protein